MLLFHVESVRWPTQLEFGVDHTSCGQQRMLVICHVAVVTQHASPDREIRRSAPDFPARRSQILWWGVFFDFLHICVGNLVYGSDPIGSDQSWSSCLVYIYLVSLCDLSLISFWSTTTKKQEGAVRLPSSRVPTDPRCSAPGGAGVATWCCHTVNSDSLRESLFTWAVGEPDFFCLCLASGQTQTKKVLCVCILSLYYYAPISLLVIFYGCIIISENTNNIDLWIWRQFLDVSVWIPGPCLRPRLDLQESSIWYSHRAGCVRPALT